MQATLKRPDTDLTRPIVLALWGTAFFCVFLQLFMGADVMVVMVDFVCVTLGLYALRIYSIFNAGALLVLFYCLGNVVIALYVKTILSQPVNSNLFAPQTSYLVELTTLSASLLALTVASKFNLGRAILPAELDAHKLTRLARLSMFIGLAAWLETHYYHLTSGGSFNGFAGFRDLLFLAVICKTASLIVRGPSRFYIDLELALLLSLSTGLGFLINSKTHTALPLISYISTIFFFEGRISLALAAIYAAATGLFVTVVAPLTQTFRFLGLLRVNFFDRINLIYAALTSPSYADLLQRLRTNAANLYGVGYYDYFRASANWVIIAGRFACIQQIDPVIARVQIWGFQNLPVISSALASIVPHIIDHAKLPFSASYYILLRLGFVSAAAGKFPTLPMAGELYANGGMAEVLFGAFAVFLVIFLVLKKLAWDLRQNVFAIFFFVDFTFVYASQGSLEQYFNAALRQFPAYAVLILFMRYLSTFSQPEHALPLPALQAAQGDHAD